MRRSLLQPILALLLVLTVSVLPILETDNTHHQKAISLVEFSIAGTSNNSNNYTSNLSWGPNSGLNAFASVDTPMTMSINITNGANVSDAVDFILTSDAGWDCIWFGTIIPCHQPNQIVIGSGELGWPQYTITVPPVVDGAPLAFMRHPFQLTAISSLDGAEVKYNFTLEPDEWFQAKFDSSNSNISLEPGKLERITLTLRNTGNSPAQLIARVVPLDSNNLPLPGFTPEQSYQHEQNISYQHDGWWVGIYNAHNLNGQGGNGIGANVQATIDIDIQPPSLATGQMKVGIVAWSNYNPTERVMITIDSSIVWERGGELFVEENCGDSDVSPEQSCSATISITNTGNFEDSFEIIVDNESWLGAELSQHTTVLTKDETKEAAILTLTVQEMTPAFSHGSVTITLKLVSGEILGIQTIGLRVAPLVNWELHAIESSIDSHDNISVAYTIRNLGNGDDGLQVSLHVDMSVEHGFVPPDQATHGSDTDTPRFFEIVQIPPGVNFTFRAWMHLPHDNEANGTIIMTVEMQSILSPDIMFVNETKIEYLADAWRPENIHEDSAWVKLEMAAADLWNQFNGLVMTILVVLAGSLGLLQALKHRAAKDAAWKARLAAAEPAAPEKPEEWMGKFDKKGGTGNKGIVGTVIEAPKIAARVFQDLFTTNTPPKSKQKEKPSESLLDAANTVLEHHETTIEGDLLDDLAGKLVIEKDSHPANELFDKVEQESGRTVRKPKQKSGSKYLKPKTESSKQSSSSTKNAKDSHTATSPAVVEQGDELDLDL
ncbi:MAG: hypothetical protein CXT67_01790 [Methanobacteriota archaeon]|jgi:hypothetical protein|nr:MAG: hypothetical protein CXT67_01790 [Euryarchaeota archaeon]HIG20377.1 hypothetical protein [Candidatus Poseidoniales archaeon]